MLWFVLNKFQDNAMWWNLTNSSVHLLIISVISINKASLNQFRVFGFITKTCAVYEEVEPYVQISVAVILELRVKNSENNQLHAVGPSVIVRCNVRSFPLGDDRQVIHLRSAHFTFSKEGLSCRSPILIWKVCVVLLYSSCHETCPEVSTVACRKQCPDRIFQH